MPVGKDALVVVLATVLIVVVVILLLTTQSPAVPSPDTFTCRHDDVSSGNRGSGPRFVFAGLARNCRNSLMQWCFWVLETVAPHIRKRWPGAQVGVVVLENGSTDGTDKALDDLCALCPHCVERVPLDLLPDRNLYTAETSSSKHFRTQKFALLRNRMLDFLRSAPYESDIAQVIPCDLDLDFSPVDPESVVRAMEAVENSDYAWVAGASAWLSRDPIRWLTGDGAYKYYDTFAVRDAYCTQELADREVINQTCQPYMSHNARPMTDTWFPVEAAFGGISVYPWNRYKRQAYSAATPQICEHVSVCRGMGGPGVIYAKLSPVCR